MFYQFVVIVVYKALTIDAVATVISNGRKWQRFSQNIRSLNAFLSGYHGRIPRFEPDNAPMRDGE